MAGLHDAAEVERGADQHQVARNRVDGFLEVANLLVEGDEVLHAHVLDHLEARDAVVLRVRNVPVVLAEDARVIGAACEQVPVQHQLQPATILAVDQVVDITFPVDAALQGQGRPIRPVLVLEFVARRTDVFQRRVHLWRLTPGTLLQLVCHGQLPVQRRWILQGGRRLHTDQTLEPRTDIMEIGRLGDEVGLGEGQTRSGLLQIDAASDAGLHTLPHVLEYFLVVGVIVTRKRYQLAVTNHVQIGLGGLKGGVFGSSEQLVVSDPAGILEPFDLARCRHAIEQQLPEGDVAPPDVVGIPAGGRDGMFLDQRFGTDMAVNIQAGQQPPASDAHLFRGRSENVITLKDFGIPYHGLLDSSLQRTDVAGRDNRRTDQYDRRERAA